MKQTEKKIRKSRITRLTVARLYNLGNYEHVRYEITAEVPRGGSAKQTLLDTVGILRGLKPLKTPYNLTTAQEVLAKAPAERTEAEKDRLEEYADVVNQHCGAKALRVIALNKLDDVGGVSVKTDAKDSWGDDAPF